MQSGIDVRAIGVRQKAFKLAEISNALLGGKIGTKTKQTNLLMLSQPHDSSPMMVAHSLKSSGSPYCALWLLLLDYPLRQRLKHTSLH